MLLFIKKGVKMSTIHRREVVKTIGLLLAGVGAGILGEKWSDASTSGEIITTSQATPQPDSVTGLYPKTSVHRTKETEQAFPIIEARVAEWVNGAVGDVFIVAPEDIVSSVTDTQTRALLSTAMQMKKSHDDGIASLSSLNAFIDENQIMFKMEEATRYFLKNKFPAIYASFGNDEDTQLDEIKSLASDFFYGSASARPFSQNANSPRYDSALIISPYYDLTKQQRAATLAKIPLHALPPIPGTDAEWAAATFAHECSHITYSSNYGLNAETAADMGFKAIYSAEQAKPDGVFKTRGLDNIWSACRSIAAVLIPGGNSHATSAPLHAENTSKDAPATSANQYEIAVTSLRKIIAYEITKNTPFLAKASLINICESILGDTEYLDGKGKIIIVDGEETILKDIINTLKTDTPLHMDIAELLMKTLRTKTKESIDGALYESYITYGLSSIQDDPALTYKTLAALHMNGDLDEMPLEKQYASDFLGAAETYFSTYFKTGFNRYKIDRHNTPAPEPSR
jgi:hypothetical protein